MESLANLECFVTTAETGSFSAAARLIGLTPAAVSRNVAMLERGLGTRLFHRSTRKLTPTEAGEQFLLSVREPLEALQAALASAREDRGEPAGVLKVGLSPKFGMDHVLPHLPEFLACFPKVRPDWRFENRPVDLVAERFDAAIGGGFELRPGIVHRPLAPVHLIAVAAPALVAGRARPSDPAGLAEFPGIAMRPARAGRVVERTMRDAAGREMASALRPDLVFDDPDALCRAAALGLGVTLVAVPDALRDLDSGALVRLLPQWYADLGSISLYYADRRLPGKTRAFVDFIVEVFRRERLAERFAGSLG